MIIKTNGNTLTITKQVDGVTVQSTYSFQYMKVVSIYAYEGTGDAYVMIKIIPYNVVQDRFGNYIRVFSEPIEVVLTGSEYFSEYKNRAINDLVLGGGTPSTLGEAIEYFKNLYVKNRLNWSGSVSIVENDEAGAF